MKKDLRSAFSKRQFMLARDFEIYYYSDLHFHTLKEHTHNYYEFYLFLEGDLDMVINETITPLTSGDVVIIPPETQHHAIMHDSDIPYRRFVMWISTEYAGQLCSASDDYAFLMKRASDGQQYIHHLSSSATHSIQSKMLRLIEENHANRYGRESVMKLMISDIILSLNRIIYEDSHPRTIDTGSDLLQNLMLYIDRNITADLSLDDISSVFYLSKYYVAHFFKDKMGISIHQYIVKKRLAACHDAIISGSDISKTFTDYGFCDYSSFFRAFKKEYGISPKECREIYLIHPSLRSPE